MIMASKKRKAQSARKRQRQTAAFSEGSKGGQSKYARKARYLKKAGLFGFQVPGPKPWK